MCRIFLKASHAFLRREPGRAFTLLHAAIILFINILLSVRMIFTFSERNLASDIFCFFFFREKKYDLSLRAIFRSELL